MRLTRILPNEADGVYRDDHPEPADGVAERRPANRRATSGDAQLVEHAAAGVRVVCLAGSAS